MRLELRHSRVPLDDGADVLIILCDPPRMILTVLVEACGIAAARNYVERHFIPHFVACRVRVEGGRPVTHPSVCASGRPPDVAGRPPATFGHTHGLCH